MPTGYTASISEGISFNEFVLRCARAFGACVTMRDDPMDKEIPVFTPSSYHEEARVEAEQELEKLSKMTMEQAEKEAESAYQCELNDTRDTIIKRQELLKKYQSMLTKCKEWEPPTEDHDDLKEFMISQITDSIKFDCDVSYYLEKKIVKLTGAEWLTNRIKDIKRDIDYHTEKYEEEKILVKDHNEWVSKLKESIVG